MKKILTSVAAAVVLASTVTACSTDADVVNQNLAEDADNFKVARQIVFINGITDKYLAEVSGLCQVENDGARIAVTCKVSDGKYIRNMMGLSDNVTYMVLQTEDNATNSSASQYKITLKPETVIPDVNFR